MIRKITLLFLLCIGLQIAVKAQGLPYVTISITTGSDTSCVGSPLTFTAVSNEGDASYKWYINDSFTHVTTTSFSSSNLANFTYVYCRIFYLVAGVTDSTESNIITIYRNPILTPHITVALTNGDNPGCPQSVLTFTAIDSNGGPSPTYQWLLNGVAIPGADSITHTGIFNNGDLVSCYTISDAPCLTNDTAYSNAIPVVHYTLIASITISGTPMPVCAGKYATFTAVTANQGANATLQWNINGAPVPGATNYVFIDTFNVNDEVTCTLFAPDICISNHIAASNIVTVSITPSLINTVTDSVIQGSNPGCLDSTLVFAGSVTNFGSNPNFTWLVNGVAKDTGAIFSTDSLSNGDTVILRVYATDDGCYRHDTLLSIPIIVHLDTAPNPPSLSLIGDHLIGNDTGTYIWYGPNGLITGDDTEMYHPVAIGYYHVQLLVDGCLSPPSNILYVSLLGVDTYNLDKVKVSPNPTKGLLTLDWGTKNANMKVDVFSVLGQGLLHDEVNNQTKKTLDLSGFADGNYFIVLRDTDGSTSTMKITVAK